MSTYHVLLQATMWAAGLAGVSLFVALVTELRSKRKAGLSAVVVMILFFGAAWYAFQGLFKPFG